MTGTNVRRSVMPSALLLAFLVVGCKQDDPIKQKEREIEARKINGGGNTIQPQQISTNHFGFDLWAKPRAESNYQIPLISEDEDPSQSFWVSASCEGFALIPGKRKNDPKNYPLRIHDEGYKGKAVSIRSVQGYRLFGFGTELVAGSLYSGAVDTGKLVGDPLESTQFGKVWTAGVPTEMKLYYQYKSGKKVIHGEEKPLPTDIPSHDRASIAGVFYEITEDATPLNGKNLHSDTRIVARAFQLINPSEPTGTWLPLTLAFEAVDAEAYKGVNFETKKYALAFVFSSSALGDKYIGAIGSELLLDELTIVSKPKP